MFGASRAASRLYAVQACTGRFSSALGWNQSKGILGALNLTPSPSSLPSRLLHTAPHVRAKSTAAAAAAVEASDEVVLSETLETLEPVAHPRSHHKQKIQPVADPSLSAEHASTMSHFVIALDC